MCTRMVVPVVMVLACSSCGTTGTQSWNYQTYDSVRIGWTEIGYIVLEQRGAEYNFGMVAPGLGPCYSATVRASVERTDATTTITPEPRRADCGQYRFVIKNDGSGGFRQNWDGTTWRNERVGVERLLTPRQ
jgi:hypothetical protein